MNGDGKTWGIVRKVYFVLGLLFAIGAVISFIVPPSIGPILPAVFAAVMLGVPLFASDYLLNRFHRTFTRYELWRK